MLIYLLRHGETLYNTQKRYQGTRDVPLSSAGRAALCKADIMPKTVYSSPLSRAVDSARILFPKARVETVFDFREMCFGTFEGRNYVEMEQDADYIAWVGEDCMGRCPGGETRAEFSQRTCNAFEALVVQALQEQQPYLCIVAHGGTQMALMERYALPHRDYYNWCADNGAGFVLDAAQWQQQKTLRFVDTVYYAKAAVSMENERAQLLKGISLK
ncbi:MAG: histidine phosphatase family protein [Pygmaiobacter sp.]